MFTGIENMKIFQQSLYTSWLLQDWLRTAETASNYHWRQKSIEINWDTVPLSMCANLQGNTGLAWFPTHFNNHRGGSSAYIVAFCFITRFRNNTTIRGGRLGVPNWIRIKIYEWLSLKEFIRITNYELSTDVKYNSYWTLNTNYEIRIRRLTITQLTTHSY